MFRFRNKYNEELLGIDYLVYSSHKTATQTVVNTLRNNGFKSIHCHSITVETTQLKKKTFKKFLKRYYRVNGRKLNIVSTFRNPLERNISSFFQWYGNGVLRKGLVGSPEETIIYKHSIDKLQQQFIGELVNKTLIGRLESIHEFCDEMKIGVRDLNYDPERQYGLMEFDYCRLYLFRFDVLIIQQRLESLFSEITGKSIVQNNANVSSDHWYYDKYTDFKASLQIPQSTISEIYDSYRDLINVMYAGAYEAVLADILDKYAL